MTVQPGMTTTEIAKLCHNVNKAYCEAIGDKSHVSWDEAPDWQKNSAIAGVEYHKRNPDAGPSGSHESWLRQKSAEGWQYGETKDVINKKHPCFVPYDQLPAVQKAKDYIFTAICKELIK